MRGGGGGGGGAEVDEAGAKVVRGGGGGGGWGGGGKMPTPGIRRINCLEKLSIFCAKKRETKVKPRLHVSAFDL